MNHAGVLVRLLKDGCRVGARDLCGKSVLHYACGGLANPSTLRMAAVCITFADKAGIAPRLVDQARGSVRVCVRARVRACACVCVCVASSLQGPWAAAPHPMGAWSLPYCSRIDLARYPSRWP